MNGKKPVEGKLDESRRSESKAKKKLVTQDKALMIEDAADRTETS